MPNDECASYSLHPSRERKYLWVHPSHGPTYWMAYDMARDIASSRKLTNHGNEQMIVECSREDFGIPPNHNKKLMRPV